MVVDIRVVNPVYLFMQDSIVILNLHTKDASYETM